MERIDIISCVGRDYLTQNIENGEFSYKQLLDEVIGKHYKLDLRFYDEKNKVAILIETKKKFVKKDKEQLFAYVSLEQKLSSQTKIIAILANTSNNNIKVWKVGEYEEELDDTKLKSMAEYVEYFKPQNINDKTAILENTARLNRMLHDNGIPEKLRSQFVGTCLLALKDGLIYKGLSTKQINAGIKEKLSLMLKDSIDKAKKLATLQSNVIESQYVENLESEGYQKLLDFIRYSILPYINDASYEGHDILSYFFTTFNKYVAREDKNQAFTPNHISHFMCRVAGIHRNTRVLDPTCGSGTFLVQAMTQILRECETDAERKKVKEEQIYGIEFDESVYGLATTNMLIHGDGNSNIRYGSCFNLEDWIVDTKSNLVLMNPPYNASKSQVPKTYANTWGKSSTDPSKGLFFVKYIADRVKQGRLLVLLPMQCAIKTDGLIGDIKQSILEEHTLDAVFSLPIDIFYPGASAVACCMVFDLGKPHPKNYKTFFGYYREDGFEKRKGVGRIDIRDKWEETEKKWYDTYRSRLTIPGLSVCKSVTSSMEWCAEAYMETDYTIISQDLFETNIRHFFAYNIISKKAKTEAKIGQSFGDIEIAHIPPVWKWFSYNEIFNIKKGKRLTKADMIEGDINYIGATDSNNGVTAKIGNDECVYDGNKITVSYNGSIAEAFYQADSFWATDDVNVLSLKHYTLNVYIAMFLTTLIHIEKYRFNYGRKWDKELMLKSKIKLPIKAGGTPDWEFMENYIKSLPYSANI